MSKRVYISADYADGDREVVNELNRWGCRAKNFRANESRVKLV